MDFWSRLIGNSASSRQSTTATPQQRFGRFKRTYDLIRTTYHKSPLLQTGSPASHTIQTSFQRLATIIQDESRSPAPHLCLQFAASSQIYIVVSRIGAVAQHEGIIREAVSVFQALIESEEEGFLETERFAHALMVFVERTVGCGNMFVGEDTESEIIELLFGIAAKIRLEPVILPVWFRDREQSRKRRQSISAGKQTKEQDFVGVTSKEDFPLCYQLIDHVHHEGRMGDFARTGLLYIFESASKSEELEKWIVASDMPTLMATGLGALYSQLSRKLSIIHATQDLPMILSLSDYEEAQASHEAEGLYSEYLQGHLSTFLSYLAFWQDVLEHCRSVDVRQTLLDHLQVLFLQQLLYPSMLESSDVDGGSAVAVITYLRHILDALDHAELVNMILQYLLALPEPARPRSPTAVKRKSSLLLLVQPPNEDDAMNPNLFSLIDLLQNSITSSNPETAIAALKLTTVILGKNHFYAIDTLIQTQSCLAQDPRRTHGALNAEVEAYIALAESVGGVSGLDEAYDVHLKDATRLTESHACSSRLLDLSALTGSTAMKPLPNPFGSGDVTSHIVRRDDAFMIKLLHGLSNFLANNVELNLAITETIVTLLTCPHFGLEGWVAVEPRHYTYPLAEMDEESERRRTATRRPTWDVEHAPALMTVIRDLADEINGLKEEIRDLDGLIAGRKQAFRLQAEIEEGSKNAQRTRSIPGTNDVSSSSTNQASSFQQRFLDTFSNTPSRSQSRGRQMNVTSGQSKNDRTSLSQHTSGLASPSSSSRSRQRKSDDGPARGNISNVETAEHQLLQDIMRAAGEERLKQRIEFPSREQMSRDGPVNTNSETTGTGEVAEKVRDETAGTREASLGHVLTNAVILQEFVLEITAIMQVRASMFDEVAFV